MLYQYYDSPWHWSPWTSYYSSLHILHHVHLFIQISYISMTCIASNHSCYPPSGKPCLRYHSFWVLSAISTSFQMKMPVLCRRLTMLPQLLCNMHLPSIGISPDLPCPRFELLSASPQSRLLWLQIRHRLWSYSPDWTHFWWSGK